MNRLLPMNRLSIYLLRALPLLVALLLYSYSVRLPFFIDDGLHFAMIKDYPANGVPGLRFWGGAISFPYYRPAVFTVWEIEQMLVGGHFDSFALHLLNVLCFGLAGVALSRVVERITRNSFASTIAGLTFVLFPFSYGAVILVAALFHMMLALFVTLALWFALMWLDERRSKLSLVLCWLCAFVAVFSHENGVLLLPLLVVLIVIVYGIKTLLTRRALILLLPIVAIIGVFLALWATVPRANDAPRLLETVFVSLGIMLQGLVYPFVALTRTLTCSIGTCAQGEPMLLWGVAVVVIVIVIALLPHPPTPSAPLGRGGARSRVVMAQLYGLTWYVLGALPAVLLLAPDYISGSPRLMVFSSLGAGIFWGASLAAIWGESRQLSVLSRQSTNYFALFAPLRFKVVFILIVTLAVFVSVRFLSERRDEALVQSDYTWQLLRLLEHDQPTAPLVVNAPAFLAPTEANRTFLTGAEGVVYMDAYVNYSQQFWAMTGVEFPHVEALAYNPTQRNMPDIVFAPYQTVGQGTFLERLRAASHIYATYFEGEQFFPVYVGSPNVDGSDEPFALFNDGDLALTEAAAVYVPEAQAVTVTTRWHVGVPIAAKPFVHVVCDGVLVGQLDGAIWGETYPFSQWSAGETQTDVRQIRLSQPVTRECLNVVAGVYWEADGVRLPVVDAATGERYADDLVPVELEQSQE